MRAKAPVGTRLWNIRKKFFSTLKNICAESQSSCKKYMPISLFEALMPCNGYETVENVQKQEKLKKIDLFRVVKWIVQVRLSNFVQFLGDLKSLNLSWSQVAGGLKTKVGSNERKTFNCESIIKTIFPQKLFV